MVRRKFQMVWLSQVDSYSTLAAIMFHWLPFVNDTSSQSISQSTAEPGGLKGLGNGCGCKARLRHACGGLRKWGLCMRTIAMLNHVFVDMQVCTMATQIYKAEDTCMKYPSSTQLLLLDTTITYSHIKSTQYSNLFSTTQLLTMSIKNVIIIGVSFSDTFC